MKVLSLTQPWATLLVGGRKRWETRSWQTKYRGPILIHAAKTFPPAARELCAQEPFAWALRCLGLGSAAELPLGAVIGCAELLTCLPIPGRTVLKRGAVAVPPAEPERSFGDYTAGRYAWLFSRPIACEPVSVPGQLGLWNLDWTRDAFLTRPLTRVVNLRWGEPYDAYIGRANQSWQLRDSPFHNSFRIGADGDRGAVLNRYIDRLRQTPYQTERAKRDLVGLTLACWCAPDLCHGDILAMLANGQPLPDGSLPVGSGARHAPTQPPLAL